MVSISDFQAMSFRRNVYKQITVFHFVQLTAGFASKSPIPSILSLSSSCLRLSPASSNEVVVAISSSSSSHCEENTHVGDRLVNEHRCCREGENAKATFAQAISWSTKAATFMVRSFSKHLLLDQSFACIAISVAYRHFNVEVMASRFVRDAAPFACFSPKAKNTILVTVMCYDVLGKFQMSPELILLLYFVIQDIQSRQADGRDGMAALSFQRHSFILRFSRRTKYVYVRTVEKQ